jgi:hypothetical protein
MTLKRNGADAKQADRIRDLEQRLAAAKVAQRAAEQDSARSRRRMQDLDDLWTEVAGHFKPFRRITAPHVSRSDLRTEAGHVMAWSDWHLGVTARPEAMAGVIENSSDLTVAAVNDIAARVLTDVEHERRTRPVDDALMVNLGDSIDGEIHPDDNWSRDLTPPEAAALAGETMGAVIDLWARNFRTVTVLMVGGSNHERTTVKPVFQKGAELSLGFLIRKIAAAAVKHHPNVTFYAPSDLEPVISWRNRYYGAMHGHQIAWRNRTPIPGMEDYYDGFQTNRVALGLPPIEMLMMGHVHQQIACRYGRMRAFPALCGSAQRAKSLYKAIDRGAQMAFLAGDRGAFAFTQYDRRA